VRRNFVPARSPLTWRQVAVGVLLLLSMPTLLALVVAFGK